MHPLVIRASAGTGKTYRLSLEFINLLLKYRVDYEDILVITFTKKATAEIRERIFLQIKEIVEKTDIGIALMQNMREDINPDLRFDQEEMAYLKKVYRSMLINKSAVRISTIDSFVNTVFSGIIAPFHNITEFQIDNKINNDILPEIYEHILQDHKIDSYRDIFLKAKRRNLETLHKFIIDIIENRWLFEFIDLSNFDEQKIKDQAESALASYKLNLQAFLELLQNEIVNYKNASTVKELLQKDFRETISSALNTLAPENFASNLFDILTQDPYLTENYKLLLDRNIWNGRRLRSKDLKDIYAEVQGNLADYLYFEKALDEQWKIISLAAEVLQKYDEIKFRDRIFTHSDINFYTFRFLYDPQISVVDKENVLNLFYEQLSFNTRFVLIDEFQDTSILQWSIFRPMLKEISSGIGQKDYGGVIVVGDEKQAIYGWRGGERKLLTDFETIFNEPVDYDSLTTSYRSKPILMSWVNRLFGSRHLDFISDWDYTASNCAKPDGGYVRIDLRNSRENSNKLKKNEIYREFVETILQPNLQEGMVDPADTALLMRKNDELKEMAAVLDESGISYTFETSGSLFTHHAVKPLMFVLNFLVYEDIIEMIKFLRSDLFLMHPAELKEVVKFYNNSEDLDDFLLKCTIHPCFSILHQLRDLQDSLLVLIQTILERFGFTQVFPSEIELKNLQRFLEVAAEFERSNHEYTNDTTGFLQYCRALSEKEEYSQIGQSVSDSLKLMTIHKSKGLQFETVFAVFDVMGRSGGYNSGLSLYYQFADNFRSLRDFAFSFNYDKVLQKSSKDALIDYVQRRDNRDELNNIYVALTRAKNNLFLYLHYAKKGGLEKLQNGISKDHSVLKNITKTICEEFNEDLQQISDVHHQMEFGAVSKDQSNEQVIRPEEFNLPDLFKIDNRKNIEENEPPNLRQLSTEFLQNRSVLIGNIVHDYLAEIYFYEKNERLHAKKTIIAKYGGLINHEKIEKVIKKTQHFIESKLEYFDRNKWNKIFNEKAVFDNNGREFRIDRLLVDTRAKKVLIIDYKTGKFYEERQLKRYAEIIRDLPVFRKEDYRIETKYLEIDIEL